MTYSKGSGSPPLPLTLRFFKGITSVMALSFCMNWWDVNEPMHEVSVVSVGFLFCFFVQFLFFVFFKFSNIHVCGETQHRMTSTLSKSSAMRLRETGEHSGLCRSMKIQNGLKCSRL